MADTTTTWSTCDAAVAIERLEADGGYAAAEPLRREARAVLGALRKAPLPRAGVAPCGREYGARNLHDQLCPDCGAGTNDDHTVEPMNARPAARRVRVRR
jgi:hypothetical protein